MKFLLSASKLSIIILLAFCVFSKDGETPKIVGPKEILNVEPHSINVIISRMKHFVLFQLNGQEGEEFFSSKLEIFN